LELGGIHVTMMRPSPRKAVTEVGAPGVVEGVSADDRTEGALVPTVFVAVTVKV
jgi:hypothetical protein